MFFLRKGNNVNLTKEVPGLNKILIGLGWNIARRDDEDFDLDVSVLMLNGKNLIPNSDYFVFYNNLKSKDGSVVHYGDNRDGKDEKDDENISIQLNKVPNEIQKIVVLTTIYQSHERNQNFGQVDHAYIRILNDDKKSEIARYDLTEDYSNVTSLIFGELYRNENNWKFKAIGQGYDEEMIETISKYGLAL